MADDRLQRKNWTLLVISAAGSTGLSPVQLQKCLFLIGKNLPVEVGDYFYSFVAYNYGPFDAAVYSDAESLVDEQLINIARASGRAWAYYVITPKGEEVAQAIRSNLSPKAWDYVSRTVAWIKRLTFSQLLMAIYKAYPEYRANSVFLKQ